MGQYASVSISENGISPLLRMHTPSLELLTHINLPIPNTLLLFKSWSKEWILAVELSECDKVKQHSVLAFLAYMNVNGCLLDCATHLLPSRDWWNDAWEIWISVTEILSFHQALRSMFNACRLFLRISRRTISNWSQVSVNSLRRKSHTLVTWYRLKAFTWTLQRQRQLWIGWFQNVRRMSGNSLDSVATLGSFWRVFHKCKTTEWSVGRAPNKPWY